MKLTGSYLQDTTDFISKIEEVSIPKDSWILSLDVVSLYTNIPHEELREVLKSCFDRRETLHPPTHFLLDLADFLMDFNYFRFDRDYFLQIKGVAMGSAYAPSAANLFMDRLENLFICNEQTNPFSKHISHYHRYIDDVFCIYSDPTSYSDFQKWINELHPTIKFTFAGDSHSVSFLDTTVFRTAQNHLAVKPFKKVTD